VTRLLLIDDEVRKAQPLINYFREVCEWNAEMASGPDQALQLLRINGECPYDVIILDVMMDPGAAIPRELTNGGRDTGLILFDAIVKLTSVRVLIVLYSARTDLDNLKSDGRIAAYIQKPTSAREIAREINELLARLAL
jgi:DNA-binding response OmpR family regulator